jgi:hypothetical protein
MSEHDWMQAIFLLMALILPVSALAGHRLNWRKGFVLALAWAWIFVIVFLVVRWTGH